MTIEALLSSIDQKLGQLIALAGHAPADVPAASQQNIAAGEAAVAAAGAAVTSPVETPKRGRGRPARGEQLATTTQATQPQVAATTQPTVQSAPDFLSLDGDAPAAARTYDIAEVRAALAVFATKEGQGKAVELLKSASGGAETLQQLKAEKYADVFKAAIPSGELEVTDVRAVLVAATARVGDPNAGVAVLKDKGGTTVLKDLTKDKFAAVINAASVLK